MPSLPWSWPAREFPAHQALSRGRRRTQEPSAAQPVDFQLSVPRMALCCLHTNHHLPSTVIEAQPVECLPLSCTGPGSPQKIGRSGAVSADAEATGQTRCLSGTRKRVNRGCCFILEGSWVPVLPPSPRS